MVFSCLYSNGHIYIYYQANKSLLTVGENNTGASKIQIILQSSYHNIAIVFISITILDFSLLQKQQMLLQYLKEQLRIEAKNLCNIRAITSRKQ